MSDDLLTCATVLPLTAEQASSDLLTRRAVARAVAYTAETYVAPDCYEWATLERYIHGKLTLTQSLPTSRMHVHHLLYRSQAVHPQALRELTKLVEQAQCYNEAHQLSGLLCYCRDGHFVQLLEGPTVEVHNLFARIRRDNRHHQVTVLNDHATPKRWFADWTMALATSEPDEFYWLLGQLEVREHNLVKPQVPLVSPHLTTLLKAFCDL